MPAKSKTQLRWAYANKRKKAAREMIKKTRTAKGLPGRVKRKRKR